MKSGRFPARLSGVFPAEGSQNSAKYASNSSYSLKKTSACGKKCSSESSVRMCTGYMDDPKSIVSAVAMVSGDDMDYGPTGGASSYYTIEDPIVREKVRNE